MKDFDQAALSAKDRTFRLGGVEFMVRAHVTPEEVLEILDFPEGDGLAAQLAHVDAHMPFMLEGKDAAKKWSAMRKQTEAPASMKGIMDAYGFAIGIVTGGRPLEPRTPSPGSSETG